ncbi:MAG: flagellar hook-length control protein FliK [Pigmentiphaga sp.]
MTALTAMTLPSSAPPPASSPRDGQAHSQAESVRADDFESKLNQATQPATPERRATEASQEANADQAGAPQTDADAEASSANTDNWAAQLAYLQPPASATPGHAVAGDAPEIDALNRLGKALTQQTESGQAENAELDVTPPVLPDARATAPVLDAAAVSAGTQATEVLSAADTASAVRPAEPAAPVVSNVALTPTASRSTELLPQVPGPATPLQPQALQQRMDEALRWMAGQGVQAAQVRIAPEALGPITIHLHMSGDQASVAFVSAVDTTRQALEANLASLKEALSQQGFSLDQTFVGSQEQHTAQQSQQEALAKQTPGSLGTDGASASSTGAAQAAASPAASRQGLVDIFA